MVLIGLLSLSTLRLAPKCQGFSHFTGFFHHSVLAKLATSSIRVNCALDESSLSIGRVVDLSAAEILTSNAEKRKKVLKSP